MHKFSITTLMPVFNKPILKQLAPLIDWWLKLSWLNKMIIAATFKKYPNDSKALLDKFTEFFPFKVNYLSEQLANIPETGPCIIVANHPTDLLDHITITTVLSKIRRDYKFAANNAVEKLQLWNDLIFPLQLSDNQTALSQNVHAIREAMRWLKAGHVLITYPGAKPSPLSEKVRQGRAIWSSLPITLASKTQAKIVPMHIILKEPLHHRLIKKWCRPIYDFLMFRVVKRFSTKSVKLSIGKPFSPESKQLSKQEWGQYLADTCAKLD